MDLVARWPSLPPKATSTVLRNLASQADRVRFSAVCRPWRTAAGSNAPPPPLPPWLALPDGTFFSFPGSTPFRFPEAARYHGSCDDRLIFERGAGEYSLLNPFSGDSVTLPSASCIRHVARRGTRRFRSVTTKPSLDDASAPAELSLRKMIVCPGQVVVAIVGDGRRGKVASWRPGMECWLASAQDPWRRLVDIAFYDGKVYAVDEDGDLFSRAVGSGDDASSGEAMVWWAAKRTLRAVPVTAPRSGCGDQETALRYLVVAGGRLLMVRRVVRSSDGRSEFTVLKADLAMSRWVNMRSVGSDTALFVGRWSSVAVRVARYGMLGDVIHFLDDDDDDVFCCLPNGERRRGQFGSYNMRSGETDPLFLTSGDMLSNAGDTPATWLVSREQEDATSGWCDLPDDVLGQILSLIPSRYRRLRLAEVCRDWRDAVRRHHPLREPAAAYLALPSGEVHAYTDLGWSHRFDDCAGYRGAARDDWLLFHDDDGLLRLKSPFTGRTRLLPGLRNVRVRDDPVEIVDEPGPRASAPPRWSPEADEMAVQKLLVRPDGLVAAVVGREHFAKVALCSMETFSWSLSARDRWRWYEDVAFCNGELYALTGDEDLLVLDLGVAGDAIVSRVERVIQGRRPAPVTVKARYLVSRGSDLFMVCRHFSCAADEPPAVWFTVFGAVLESSSSPSQWTEVSSLGGEAVFVGRMCSKAVREDDAVRGDQIFFLHDDFMPFWAQHTKIRPRHHAGVYDMRDGTITNILHRRHMCNGPAPPTWLFPQCRRDNMF